MNRLKYFVRNKYAWPGGYPMFAVTKDGGVLSHEAVRENYPTILRAIRSGADPQWEVVGVDINWEDANLFCDHTNQRIESAYAEEETA